MITEPLALNVAEQSSAELLDELIHSISDLNSPKNISSDLIRSLLIDAHSYRTRHADLADMSNDELLLHWFEHGHHESSRKYTPNFYCLDTAKIAEVGIVVYLSSAPTLADGSYLYRTKYSSMRDSRESHFYTTKSPINELIYAIFMAKEIVFSRPDNADPLAIYLILLAKVLGVKITLDFDDVLLPELFRESGLGRTAFSTTTNKAHEERLGLRSSFLPYADQVCCSTEYIQNALSHLSMPTILRYNKLPVCYASDFEIVKKRIYGINNRKINILYMSGTATHGKDFEICQGPLVKLAQNYSDKFNLILLGQVQLSIRSMMEYLGVNVIHVGRLSYDEMHGFIAQQDLCLVPLENTYFNNSKSNIKFIEAGIHGVPVVASSVDQFKRSISNSINGWLCDQPNDWYNQLTSIVKQKSNIVSVSLAAYKSSLQNYTF